MDNATQKTIDKSFWKKVKYDEKKEMKKKKKKKKCRNWLCFP